MLNFSEQMDLKTDYEDNYNLKSDGLFYLKIGIESDFMKYF